jgi:O-glycosyl hydrolase
VTEPLEPRVFLSAVNVAINTATHYQQIDGFGTTMFLPENGYYENPAYQKMYYQDLGSSMLRMNLELDALEGPGATIASPVTLVDDLQTNISMFNFQQPDVQSDGQLAAASKTYGLDSFKLIGSLWTPPHWMKGPEVDYVTGVPDGNLPFLSYSGTNSAQGSLIDTPANLQQFGRYVAAYVAGFQQTFGVPFYAISIQNELIFSEPYNSCVYTPQIYVDAVKAVHNAFVEYGITTKIEGPEDVGVATTAFTAILNRQLSFINAVNADPAAKAALDIYSTHGYADDPVTYGRSPTMWGNLWNAVSGDGKELWQTEISRGTHDASGALLMAENAQDALIQGNVSAWLNWQTSTGQAIDSTDQGTLTTGLDETDPKFGAAQQFFRYIRPGSVRVSATPSDPNGVYVSAFVQSAQHTLTSVLVNAGTTTQTVNINVSGVSLASFNVDRLSDATHTFADQGPVTVNNGIATITLSAQSIITLQGDTLVIAPVVTGLTAAATNAQAMLNWNPSSGAATYNVKRATVSGGPYTTVITGVTGTAYTDMGLSNGITYYYVVTAVNAAGESGISNQASATPVAPSSVDTIFSSNSAPVGYLTNVNDPNITSKGGVTVGLKFRSDVAGTVNGVRFYKGTQDTGVHAGELWTTGGTLLATATFNSESASGWQQVSFSKPISIAANTTYIVSYHTAAAFIAYTPGTLAQSGIDSAPLHVLANGVDGNNGVYNYDAIPGAPLFPSTFNSQSPNYWVDVSFSPSVAVVDTILGSSAPAGNLQNVNDPAIASSGGVEVGLKFRSDVAGTVMAVRFYKGSFEGGTQTGQLWSSTGQLLASTTFSNESPSGWQQASFAMPVTISANTTYIIAYHTTSPYIAYTPGALATAGIDSSPLHILASGVDGNNGVYHYDTTPGTPVFPTVFNSQSPNYWVDVVFQPS